MRRAVVACLGLFCALSCRRVQYVYMPPSHFASAASHELVTSHLHDAASIERSMSQAATGDTTPHEAVVAHIEETSGSDSTGPTFLRVTSGHYSGGDYYDSILVRRADLLPIREHMAYIQRHLEKRMEYLHDGTTVHQTNTVGDSTVTFDKSYTVPVYGFSEIEMIIRSLPFHPYYTAIVPLYSEGDDALEQDSITVVNDRPGKRWTVRFADPVVVAMYGIDASSRQILSYYVRNRKSGNSMYKIYDAAGNR